MARVFFYGITTKNMMNMSFVEGVVAAFRHKDKWIEVDIESANRKEWFDTPTFQVDRIIARSSETGKPTLFDTLGVYTAVEEGYRLLIGYESTNISDQIQGFDISAPSGNSGGNTQPSDGNTSDAGAGEGTASGDGADLDDLDGNTSDAGAGEDTVSGDGTDLDDLDGDGADLDVDGDEAADDDI